MSSEGGFSVVVSGAVAPESTRPVTSVALAPQPPKVSIFDPSFYNLSSLIHDPTYLAIHQFKWSDRQQHGRLAYDTMYKHGAVNGPFDTLVSFLKSYRPLFKPSGTDPTQRQRDFADYANDQLRRLGANGDPRQGYEKLVEWFAQGLKYGFSVSEMATIRAPWRGQSRIQIHRIVPVAQASLDHGYMPLEEFGQGMSSTTDVRYRCFDLDSSGQIQGVTQYHQAGKQSEIRWEGSDLLRLLIYTHGGGEGNPYGQSLLYTAFYHWASLYTLEQMEEAFLNASLPYLTMSYKTPDGRPSPETHASFIEIIKQQDPAIRGIAAPDATFSSVAPTNPSFTEHATQKKSELRRYITNCLLGIPVMQGEAGNELDARNAIDVFFRHLMPALQREIATVLTWQFARRLIDANWSGVSVEEYPEVTFQSTMSNDLRIAMPLIQQLIPALAAKRFGESMEVLIPGFDRAWIANDPKDSVASVLGPLNPAPSNPGSSQPPAHQEGTPESRHDGTTGNIGGKTRT